MPASDFLVELSYDQAKQKFDEFLYAFMGNYTFKDSLQPHRNAPAETKFSSLLGNGNSDPVFGKVSIDLFYPGGYDLAFRLARTEAEGGVHQIIRTMFENMTEWSINNKVKKLVQRTWGNAFGTWSERVGGEYLDHKAVLHGEPEDRAKHVRAYKSSYSAFLPVEYLEENDPRSALNFDEVLRNHHKLVQRMRGLIN